jgi:hypothetical protein
MGRHAVITEQGISAISLTARKVEKYTLPCPITNIMDAWKVGKDTGITHFWVMPGTELDNSSAMFANSEDYKVFATYDDEQQEFPRFARCKKDGYEVYMGRVQQFGWEVQTPLDILSTVDYLTRLLGTDIVWSPSYVGKAVFKKGYSTTDVLRNRVRESTVDLRQLPFTEAAGAVYWKRGGLETLQPGHYLHHVDRNSSYLATCKSVYTGVGDPVHLVAGDSPILGTCAGIYRVTWNVGESPFNGRDLPVIIRDSQEWVTQDLLQLAIKQGYDLDIKEAWIFEQSHQLFRKWADKICDVREALKTDVVSYPYERGRINAYNTDKAIAVATIGSFANKEVKQFIRPNWNADIVGKARVTILNTLNKFQKYHPVLACADDIWFLSPHGDIQTAVSDVLVRSESVGGYKPKHTVKVIPQIVEKLVALSPIAAHTYLKNGVCYE